MRTIKLKNPQASEDVWYGITVGAGEYSDAISEAERMSLVFNVKVNQDIWSTPAKLVINDGESDLDPAQADNWLKGTIAHEVIPKAPANDFTLKPLGIVHKHIDSSSFVKSITLSNKDGSTYDYSCSGYTPAPWDCIYNSTSELRSGIIGVDSEEGTVTLHDDSLANGDYSLCQSVNMDWHVYTDEDPAPTYIYLWGTIFDVANYGDDDLIRMQIVDLDGWGVAAGLYTQEQFEAMGSDVLIKEYDECWARHAAKVGKFMTPDGAPGEIPVGLYLRLKYYPKDSSKTDIKVWVDYIVTIKD